MKKAIYKRDGKRLLAEIVGPCLEYPKTAFRVIWKKEDNPSESWPEGVPAFYSITHKSQIEFI